MRRLLLPVLLLLPAAATAAEGRPAERVLRLQELEVKGEAEGPQLLYVLDRTRPSLPRDRARRRSFLPEIEASIRASER